MKYIKLYKIFERDEDLKTVNEIEDIFIHIKDFGIEVSNVWTGNSLGMGDKKVATHREISNSSETFRSFSIRLKADVSDAFLQNIERSFYQDLESAINHVESLFNYKFSHFYIRTFDGAWVSNTSSFEEWADSNNLTWVSYLDLIFRIPEKTNENLKKIRTGEYLYQERVLKSIFDDVKDIIRDIEDDHDINFEVTIGEYHKTIHNHQGLGYVKYLDSINIDIADNSYNFFRFNDHILPTLNKLKSFLSEYNLNIDIECVQENEFYPLEEFINEYGSEEFHELGIIIY